MRVVVSEPAPTVYEPLTTTEYSRLNRLPHNIFEPVERRCLGAAALFKENPKRTQNAYTTQFTLSLTPQKHLNTRVISMAGWRKSTEMTDNDRMARVFQLVWAEIL